MKYSTGDIIKCSYTNTLFEVGEFNVDSDKFTLKRVFDGAEFEVFRCAVNNTFSLYEKAEKPYKADTIQRTRVSNTEIETKGLSPLKRDWREKPPLDLIPLEALQDTALGYGFGAYEKYAPHDWKTLGLPVDEYLRATIGHCYEILAGQVEDAESGLHPICHALARLTMASYLIKKGE